MNSTTITSSLDIVPLNILTRDFSILPVYMCTFNPVYDFYFLSLIMCYYQLGNVFDLNIGKMQTRRDKFPYYVKTY